MSGHPVCMVCERPARRLPSTKKHATKHRFFCTLRHAADWALVYVEDYASSHWCKQTKEVEWTSLSDCEFCQSNEVGL